jgi:hypothetical protein
MADSKITGLGSLSTAPDNLDLLVMVDVSDTSMAGTGTDKQVTFAVFENAIRGRSLANLSGMTNL